MWQWLSAADGFWHLYDAQAQRILNEAMATGADTAVMFIEGQCTVVNLKALSHVDSLTGFSCKIRFFGGFSYSKLPPRFGSTPSRSDAFFPPSVLLVAQNDPEHPKMLETTNPKLSASATQISPFLAADSLVAAPQDSTPPALPRTVMANKLLPTSDSTTTASSVAAAVPSILSCPSTLPGQGSPLAASQASPFILNITILSAEALKNVPFIPALEHMTGWLNSIVLPPPPPPLPSFDADIDANAK